MHLCLTTYLRTQQGHVMTHASHEGKGRHSDHNSKTSDTLVPGTFDRSVVILINKVLKVI